MRARTHPNTGGKKALPHLLLLWMAAFLCLVAAVCESLVWPEATGDQVAKKSGTVIDYSHAADGYVMVKQKAGSKRYKLRVEKGGETYTYDLNSEGEYEVFPLQLGTGAYTVKVYQQSSGNKYSAVSSQSIKVKEFSNENACFLCPSQYVNYTADTTAVLTSQALCASLTSDAQKVVALQEYILQGVRYNYVRALTVEKGYLPDLDEVLSSHMGICFDYATVFACMLRVQGIPTKMIIGYADDAYHAWNEVLLDGSWVRYDLTAQASNMNVKAYTTERFY